MSQNVHIIDVQSGNLQSLENAIKEVGDFKITYIRSSEEFSEVYDDIDHLIFPGVGNYGHFVKQLNELGLSAQLKEYVQAGRKIMGICVGLQAFMTSSEESPGVIGLGLLDFELFKFDKNDSGSSPDLQIKAVPHIGWNSGSFSSKRQLGEVSQYGINNLDKYYFVHSYAAILRDQAVENKFRSYESKGWKFTVSRYGSEKFLSSIAYRGLFATQFHPEKSGRAGLSILSEFLTGKSLPESFSRVLRDGKTEENGNGLTKRIIACLDVRENDKGDLVVTKGDQYDVRESGEGGALSIRNLGKPVDLAYKYFQQGADEITFLNITSFRNTPVRDLPMLEVLKLAAAKIFVPLTVGGGIKSTTDPVTGEVFSALDVANLYFKAGADKVSIGSEAVAIAEDYYANGQQARGTSAIETISSCFGTQAVVISVDPKRKYLHSPSETTMNVINITDPLSFGPEGECYCYYQVTSQGGRKIHDLGALELCVACERLGAGEILLNSIDRDGTNKGFNLELLTQIKENVSIPVIASSGAGRPEHFEEVFRLPCGVDAALGAGMFHRGDYTVHDVKLYLAENCGIDVRLE